jgi:hypothetical protein
MVQQDTVGTAAYLAAACFDSNFMNQGHFIFRTYGPGGTHPADPSIWRWNYYGGPFGVPDASGIPDLPTNYQPPPGFSQPPNSLSKFDWAVRPPCATCNGIGQLIAIATPEYVDTSSGSVQDYQCLAMDFTLPQGVPTTPPFTSLLATVWDTDTSGPNGSAESNGPGACTYDPLSNTGIVTVRHLTTSAGYDLYSIINSGIMP